MMGCSERGRTLCYLLRYVEGLDGDLPLILGQRAGSAFTSGLYRVGRKGVGMVGECRAGQCLYTGRDECSQSREWNGLGFEDEVGISLARAGMMASNAC